MRHRHWLLTFLILVAFALRVWYLSINPLWPQFSNADDGDYYRRALRLAVTGAYVDDAWLIRPPFHVWVFAALLRVAIVFEAGPAVGVRLIQWFHILLGVVSVPLCYALGARLFNRWAGLIFAAFWAIWFPFVELTATLFSEPIYLFLWLLHLWLLLRYDDQGRVRDLALSGLVLGMAALTRSPALYALVFAVPWLVWRAWNTLPAGAWTSRLVRATRRTIAPLAILGTTTLAVVTPWTMRNWIEYRHFIPVDTLGPINLWLDLANGESRDSKINRLRALPQAERQSYASAQARAILRDDPLLPFRPMWGTFRHIVKAQYVEDYFIKRSFFTRPLREAAPLGLPGDLIWLVFSFAGIVGLLHPATDRPWKVLAALWFGYSTATVLIFHVEPRYLLSIWVMLGLYGSAVLSGFASWRFALRPRTPRALLTVATVLVLAGLFITYRNYPAILMRGSAREWAMLRSERAFQAGDYPAAEREARAALQADPGFVDAEVALALALKAQGRAAQGIEELERGSSRRTDLVLGDLMRATGDIDGARELLRASEARSGEDTQRWTMLNTKPEPRSEVVLGDDGLDLGYIEGFGLGETAGGRTMRWLLGDGHIVLPLETPFASGAVVALDLASPFALPGPLEVVVEGRWRYHLNVAPDWRTYYLAVPADAGTPAQLDIALSAPTRIPAQIDPASDDARPLSVMVHRVALVP
jgi:4-amino-4-deoxy-L-arabinose transferase-like glycosyltransferase